MHPWNSDCPFKLVCGQEKPVPKKQKILELGQGNYVFITYMLQIDPLVNVLALALYLWKRCWKEGFGINAIATIVTCDFYCLQKMRHIFVCIFHLNYLFRFNYFSMFNSLMSGDTCFSCTRMILYCNVKTIEYQVSSWIKHTPLTLVWNVQFPIKNSLWKIASRYELSNS